MNTNQISFSKKLSTFFFLSGALFHFNAFTSDDGQDKVRGITFLDIIKGFKDGGKRLQKNGSAIGSIVYEKLANAKNIVEEKLLEMSIEIEKEHERRREIKRAAVDEYIKRSRLASQKKSEMDPVLNDVKTELSKEQNADSQTTALPIDDKKLLDDGPKQDEVTSQEQVLDMIGNQNSDDDIKNESELMSFTNVALASAGIVGVSFVVYKAYQYWLISNSNASEMIKDAIKNSSEKNLSKSVKTLEKWTGLSLARDLRTKLNKSTFIDVLAKIDKVKSVKNKKLFYAQMLLMFELSDKNSKLIVSKMALL